MSLYDTPADVVRKSIVGLALTPEIVALRAGMESREIMALLNGSFSENAARRLAPILGLNADALCSLPAYQPASPDLHGIQRISVPFEDDEVNIWLIESADTVLAIDCGFRPDDFLRLIESLHERLIHLFITHAHRDHIGGLTAVTKERLSSLHSPEEVGYSTTIRDGDTIEIGPLKIRAFDLSGHHPQTLGYHISGPEIEVFAVGDAVFAGSMGGCADSEAFARARRTIEAAFSGVGPEAVLLPGHGPATTLGSELRSNPFLADWLI